MDKELLERAENCCELCGSTQELTVFQIEPSRNRAADDAVLLCELCIAEVNKENGFNQNHLRCLNDSIWSEVDAVKVLSYRLLSKMKGEGWTDELLDMMYLEGDALAWAKAGIVDVDSQVKHVDSNGAVLQAGDNVVLIKDLDVKGANFTAKRGTAVRGITLVHDNANQIEGRVNGQHIVILTQFVKKS